MPFVPVASVADAAGYAVQNLWTIKLDGARDVADDVESFRAAVFEGNGVLAGGSANVADETVRDSLQAWNASLRHLRSEFPNGIEADPFGMFMYQFIRTLQYMLLAVSRGVGDSGSTIPDGVIAQYNAYLAS